MSSNLVKLVVLAHVECGGTLPLQIEQAQAAGPRAARPRGLALRNLLEACERTGRWTEALVLARMGRELLEATPDAPEPAVAVTLPPSVRRLLPVVIDTETMGTRQAATGLFEEAEERVTALAPYTHPEIVPDLAPVIARATLRGVGVELIAEPPSPRHDPREFFRGIREHVKQEGRLGLLRTGTTRLSSTGTLHAKIVVADTVAALVGSGNLTGRALSQNIEAGILVRGPPARVIRQITDAFLQATGVEWHEPPP